MRSTPDVDIVGQILKDARTEAGFSQDDLAELARMPQQRISRLERGIVADPGMRELVHLAEILRIDIFDLITPFAPRPSGRRRPQLQAAS